jgi:phosphoribosylformimino-5-aminoimidazole carboxamide ribotide isomerase
MSEPASLRRDPPRLTLYPAIDLKNGACVRLRRGAMEQATVYSDDPAAQARAWQNAGCRWLHVVDLNGAFAGRPVNAAAVEAILAAVEIPVQLGGGIRDMAAVAHWLEAGVRRVVLGSAAVKDPALVREACRAFPGRVAVGIDARDGLVAVEGWAEMSSRRAAELARAVEDAGAAAIIFTDIGRDGMLAGLNVEATAELARQVTMPVIASGGVAGVADLRQLAAAASRMARGVIEGVVVGRALYDGQLDIRSALSALCA